MKARMTRRLGTTNLPVDITSFIGRRRELTAARRLLSASPLVTFTGPGGVGKTRLALRATTDLPTTCAEDGVWWVELADVRGDEAVAHAVADVVGLRAPGEVSLAESLANHLAHRNVLLVLDNCEHLIDSCSALISELLRRCSGLRVLATSRFPLCIRGEHVLPVSPLAIPTVGDDAKPDELVVFDSVSLFVERASAGCPSFALTPKNVTHVVRICQELEGIPLAIELAAARVRSLPLDAIVCRLKSGQSSLAIDQARRDLPRQHRSLPASVEWSYELCSAIERNIWARLSVFAGGFELEAGVAVCRTPGVPAGQATDAIASLTDKSVLIREETESGVRYRMLDIIREFGSDRLIGSGESSALRSQHAEWFLALTENAYNHWLTEQQPAMVARLRDDYLNLRAAFSTMLDRPDDDQAALQMASALEHYWVVRGWQTEGRQWLDAALEKDAEHSVHRARALRVNAYLMALQCSPGASALIREARKVAGQVDDRTELAYADAVEGMIEMCEGRLDSARALIDNALECFRRDDDQLGEVFALVVLGALAAALGDLSLAELSHRRCEELAAPRSEVHLRGISFWACGLAALRAGDTKRARELQCISLRLNRGLADQFGTTLAMEVIAWIDVAECRDERAATLLGACDRLWSPMRMTMNTILAFGRYEQEYEYQLEERLGQARFQASHRRGGRMSLDEALAFALGEDAGEATGNPLTRREREVAEYIARGLTNKRIAHEFTVSQRTVEGHVQRIMTKLGFTNRAQIAAWTARIDS